MDDLMVSRSKESMIGKLRLAGAELCIYGIDRGGIRFMLESKQGKFEVGAQQALVLVTAKEAIIWGGWEPTAKESENDGKQRPIQPGW